WKTGMWAWILHRATGIGITIYLAMHVWVVSSLQNPERFDRVMAFVNQPLFKFLEIGLLAAVLYHALNGIRVIIIDWMGGTRVQARLFWISITVFIIVFTAGSVTFLQHAFGH
ncbi:succinate dehydrogenase, cytochrome b556 subunit, partial [bacterium]|nr:succinate dehydrogenase, cytochrome b556 subunit [bacterium]